MVRIKPVKIIKRGHSYQLYYYNPRGERRRLSVGSDYQQIQRMVVKFNDWLLDGKDPESKEGGKRDVYFSPQQAMSLISELPDPLANIVEFAIYTGFRKENILSLSIDSVRFHDLTPTGEVELVVKGGRRELFPLGSAAVEVVKQAIGNRTEGYVFINPVTGTRYVCIHKTFDRVVRSLGITISNGTKLRINDLRHVFATWLHKQGVSLDELRSLLGHKDRATTDRYTSIDRLDTGKVLEKIPRLRAFGQKKNLDSRKAAGLL